MFKLKQSMILSLMLVLCLSAGLSPVYAAGGDGTGGGNGENRDIPLTLESASIRDGSRDIPVNPTIQLNFNKNICNVLVLSNNKKCFHLTDAKGKAVPIRLIFPDDQVQQGYKRQAFLIPRKNLKENSTYRIAVDRTLMAKNGNTIDNAHTITFTTGSRTVQEENKILKKLGDFTLTYETALGEGADSVPVNTAGLDDISQDQTADTGLMAKIAAASFLILILAFTLVLILLRRKRK